MKSGNRKLNIAIPAVLAVCLLLFLLIGGIYFTQYLKAQIFAERTTQLNEITSQVRVNLSNALDSHWNYLTSAVNELSARGVDTVEEASELMAYLEELLEMKNYSSMLMLLDSQGNCYDANGKHGVWSDIELLSDGKDRYTFISNSYIYQGSYWTFVQKLDAPLEAEQDGISFTHAVLLKDVRTLKEYYDSAAYGDQNETYILKSNGTRMYDDMSGNNTLSAYNVLKVLEEMDGQAFRDIRAELESRDTISTNFIKDGTEYYYCVTSLAEYDTLLLFLIPAQFVAEGTVNMVEAVIGTLMALAVVLIVMLGLVVMAIMRQRSSVRLFHQEQENLRRMEEMNAQLEQSNTMLAQSKETAEQAFQIAEEANRAKSSFLSNMSHDIRTPMNAIVGFSALLARDAENPEKVREYTRKITSSGQHLLGLINDILDISKIEAGKTTLNLSDESIVDLIENIDSIIRPQMKAREHSFEVYARELKHEHVIMDKLRLNQILLNLLSNAMKYTPDGGHITFTVQELPQYAKQLAHFRFIVADNGYGMSEEYQEKLFQAFTREEDSVTNKIQGTGLGMAITKNLLDLMGGSISVKSRKGEGSVFTVDLELQISEHSVDHDFWKKNGITRMLIVDDEEPVCRDIRLIMEDAGVQADYTLDGAGAAELVKQADAEGRPYNVVLIDGDMKDISGARTAGLIRSVGAGGRPVLALISYDWTELEDEACRAGVDTFIPKPFFLTTFRQKVDAVINHALEAEAPGHGQGGDSGQSVLQGMRILVAEDNEINAEILSELLDMAGASCDIYENGRLLVEAFEKSAPQEYRMILMDVQMPVMNGYEATRAIRESGHPMAVSIPIIAMTANAFAEDIRDALESGMNAHVAKPIDMSVLEQTVRAVLESRPDGSG